MLLKNLRMVMVGGASVAFAMTANAQGPKIGFEYRAGLTYDDGGYEETTGVDASSTTVIAAEFLNVTAEGSAAKDVDFAFSYNTLAGADQGLQVGYAKLKMGMFGVLFGRNRANVGGWHAKDHFWTYNNLHTSASHTYMMWHSPFSIFEDMIELGVNVAGTLSVQLVNDAKSTIVTKTEGTGTVIDTENSENAWAKNDKNKNPAGLVQWMGDFNGWKPLIQIGSYDLNHSTFYSIGLKGSVAGLGLMLNYLTDSRKNYAAQNMGATTTPKKDTLTQIDAEFSYSLGGWMPFLAYNKFDYKQNSTDLKYNSTARMMDDNAQSITVGVVCNAVGKGLEPYVSIASDTSNVHDPKKAATENVAESRSNLTGKLGVMGKF